MVRLSQDERKGAVAMSKKLMKSYRVSEDVLFELESIANGLGLSQTEALELAIDWFYQSPMLSSLERVRNRDGVVHPRVLLGKIVKDDELESVISFKTWTA